MLDAAPIISIDSPPPGDLYDLRPTITIVYSSDNPISPLDLNSLLITVNGADWTAKFTRTAEEAVYAVTAQDQLIAGEAKIVASIWDTAELPVQAIDSHIYRVFPTFEAMSPGIGREGTGLTLTVQGLDPTDPTKNEAVFRGAFAPEVVVAFETVDPVLSRGTVKIPDYSATGPVFAQVNGNRSAASLPVTVLSEFPRCSAYWQTEDILSMSDGGVLVNYDAYHPAVDPACPPIPAGFRDPVVVRMRPNGGIDMVGSSWPSAPNAPVTQYLQAMALDKTGLEPALVYEEFTTAGAIYTPFVMYKGMKSHFGTALHPWDADFDGYGNLYLIVSTTKDDHAANRIIRLLRIPAAALAAGGNVVPEVVADNLQTDSTCGVRAKLRVSCDGSAYVALRGCWDTPSYGQTVFYGGALLKILVQDGQVVANTPVTDGQLNDIALTCGGGEVYGTKMKDAWFLPGDNEVWRSVDAGPLERIVPLPNSVAAEKLTVSPAGNIYISYYVPAERAILKVPYQVPGCGSANAQPFCALWPLRILPSTTRWRPQKDTSNASAPIEIIFRGPSDLADPTAWPSKTAEIKDANGAAVPTPNLAFSVVNQPANEYKLTWSGPWLTNPSNPASYLPRGNYDVVVKATKADGTEVTSPPYHKVSLVEVTQMEFRPLPGAPPLDGNPGPGGGVPPSGARIFAEALAPIEIDPAQPVFDRVEVVATIDPAIPDPGAQGPVRVYFRPIDVDDPAPDGPIDDETEPLDNRGDQASLTDEHGVEILNAYIVSLPALGAEARTVLRVSRRQGDNYRLAASTSSDWPLGLSVVVPSQIGAVVHATDPSVPEGIQLSEMLTVWRTLHVEQDRFEPGQLTQENFQLNGTWTALFSLTLVDGARPFLDWRNADGDVDKPYEYDGWKEADVNPYAPAGQDFLVKNNDDITVSIGNGNMELIGDPYDRRYYLRDDKLESLTQRSHDTSTAREILNSVYIEVEGVSSDPPVPSFVQNLREDTHLSMLGDYTNGPLYWNVPLVLAFEADLNADDDPTGEGEGGAFGRCKPYEQPLAAVFTETIRDVRERDDPCGPTVTIDELYATTAAHELLHGMGLIHEGDTTGGIMCSGFNSRVINGDARKDITVAQRAFLRGITMPNFQPAEGVCPFQPTCP